jgi:hypothetical protein
VDFVLLRKMIYFKPKLPESCITYSDKQCTEEIEQVGFTVPSQVTSQQHAGVPQRGYGFQMNFSLSHHRQEGSQ